MKKFLFGFSTVLVLLLVPGCSAEKQTSGVAYDYDERCWVDDHWVYRFKEKDSWIYRHWEKNKWEEDAKPLQSWDKRLWEKNPLMIAGSGAGLTPK